MKYVMAFAALLSLVGFVGFSSAAEKPKVRKGHFVKVEEKVLTYKSGLKGTGRERTVKIDDKTKITLDGKDATVADLKADMYLEVTDVDGTASIIAASTKTPTEAPKTQKAPDSATK